MDDVYRVLRYLKINPGKRIFFKKSSVRDIKMYTDADWDGSQADRRSTSEYCTILWGNFDDLEKQKTWRRKNLWWHASVQKKNIEL